MKEEPIAMELRTLQCRRRKVACDHQTPVCGRCMRQDKAEQCKYVSAPMSGRARQDVQHVENGSPTTGTSAQQPASGSLQASMPTSPTQPTPNQQHASGSMQAPKPMAATQPTPALHNRHYNSIGFLGPTSFSSIFLENYESSNIPESLKELSAGREPVIVTDADLQQGAEVLLVFLRCMPLWSEIHERFKRLYASWDIGVVYETLIGIWCAEAKQLFDDAAAQLTENALLEKCRAVSNLVWQNSNSEDVIDENTTMQIWAKGFTGQHLRWEIIGTILGMLVLTACNAEGWKDIKDLTADRHADGLEFAGHLHTSIAACRHFCGRYEVLNEAYLMLVMVEGTVLEMIKGDLRVANWKLQGEFSDALVAMGLHRTSTPSSYNKPLWYLEIRRQLFAVCYCRDKWFSYALGRPPRLGSKFCHMELPLDISAAEFTEIQSGEQLRSLTHESGWSKADSLHRVTWLRLRTQYLRICEDILEISLGNPLEYEDLMQRANLISQKIDAWSESTPAKVRDHIDLALGFLRAPSASVPLDPEVRSNLLNAVAMHLRGAQARYFLQRTIYSQTLIMSEEIISTARKILDFTLQIEKIRSLFQDWPSDVAAMLVLTSVPCAGLLAIALIREQQSSIQTVSTVPGRKSDIIQKICFLIAAIQGVGPEDNLYGLCRQYGAVLQRLLDMILEPSSRTTSHATTSDADIPDLNGFEFTFTAEHDPEFLQWLETLS